MADLPHRRAVRVGLLTFLLAFSIVAIWLGWNANIVRQRRAMVAEEQWVGLNPTKLPTPNLPWVRRLMGDEPVRILATAHEPSNEELNRARGLFPEAKVIPRFFRSPSRDN
jgi:hypothetical protein